MDSGYTSLGSTYNCPPGTSGTCRSVFTGGNAFTNNGGNLNEILVFSVSAGTQLWHRDQEIDLEIEISPDGTEINVANKYSRDISQWDRKNNGALSNLKINYNGWKSGMDIRMSLDGGNVYAVDGSSNSLHYWQRVKPCPLSVIADAACIVCPSTRVCTALTCTTYGKFDIDKDATNGCEASFCPNTVGKNVSFI